MPKKLTKTQMKKTLNTARMALNKLFIEKVRSNEGPLSVQALMDMNKKLNIANNKLK